MSATDRPPANAAGRPDPSLLPAALAGAALALGAIALGHAALVLDGLEGAFATVVAAPSTDLPWWSRLRMFTWLAAVVQAASAAWGGWRAWQRRGTPGGTADLRAALWLVFAMHAAQGAGIGAIVPADAPFRPTALGGVFVALVATLAATAWLRRARVVRLAYGQADAPTPAPVPGAASAPGPERDVGDGAGSPVAPATTATPPMPTPAAHGFAGTVANAASTGDAGPSTVPTASAPQGRAADGTTGDAATDDPTADDTAWAAAMAEVSDPARREPGLWARCFALADGDEKRATAAYLRERVARDLRARRAGSAPR